MKCFKNKNKCKLISLVCVFVFMIIIQTRFPRIVYAAAYSTRGYELNWNNSNESVPDTNENAFLDLKDSFGRGICEAYNIHYNYNGDERQTSYKDYGYSALLSVDNIEAWMGRAKYLGTTENESDAKCTGINGISLTNIWFNNDFVDAAGNKFTQINFVVTNYGSNEKKFSLATTCDIQMGSDDNAFCRAISKNGKSYGFTTTNAFCENTIVGGENAFSVNVYTNNTPGVTNADTLSLMGWNSQKSMAFTDIILKNSAFSINKEYHSAVTGSTGFLDTGFAIGWKDRTLKPGESTTLSYILGTTEYKDSNIQTNEYYKQVYNSDNTYSWQKFDSNEVNISYNNTYTTPNAQEHNPSIEDYNYMSCTLNDGTVVTDNVTSYTVFSNNVNKFYYSLKDKTPPKIDGVDSNYNDTKNIIINPNAYDFESQIKSLNLYDSNDKLLISSDVGCTEYKSAIWNNVDYGYVFNADYYAKNNQDVVDALGNNPEVLLRHFYDNGMAEGRKGNDVFDLNTYKTCNGDVAAAYGNDSKAYYTHYCQFGHLEKRVAKKVSLNIPSSSLKNGAYYLVATDNAGNKSKKEFTVAFETSEKVVVNHYVMDTTGKYPTVPDKTVTVNFELNKKFLMTDLINSDLLVTGIVYDHAVVDGSACEEYIINTGTKEINLYYAREQHNVTYDTATNGGTWPDGDVKNKTVKVYYDAEIDLSLSGRKQDWNFIGWNTDKNQKIGTTTSMKMGNQDITLYALYNRQFTVTFVDCSGSRVVNLDINNNAQSTIDALEITPYDEWKNVSDKHIVGWTKEKEVNIDSIKYDLESGQKNVEVTDNSVYYAIYSASAELKYDLQGGIEDERTNPVKATVYKNAYKLDNTIAKEIVLPDAMKDTVEKDGYIHTYSFKGWAENSLVGQLYLVSEKYVISQNTTMYAVWDDASHGINYTIKFEPNGGTGSMESIKAVFDTELILPENEFKRATDWGKSKFLGWNTNSNTKEIQCNDQEKVKNLADKDGAVVILYAIWDDCPEIEAVDRYYTLEQAQAGSITAADLLTTASATDDIDGVITDGLTVKNYSSDEFTQFQSDGSATVTYQAQDSGGNKSTKTVTVYIVDTSTEVIKDNKYVRFISEKYYQNEPEDGGLEVDSKWRKNSEYAAVLQSAMENRKSLTEETASMNVFGYIYTVNKPGSVSRDHTYQTWKFTHEDVLRVKQYIQDNGVGNSRSNTALSEFYQEFSTCIQK